MHTCQRHILHNQIDGHRTLISPGRITGELPRLGGIDTIGSFSQIIWFKDTPVPTGIPGGSRYDMSAELGD